MKILVLAGGFPKINEGTDGNYVYAQVSELAKLGNEITVVSPTMYFPKAFSRIKKINRYIVPQNYIYDNIHVEAPKMLNYYCFSQYWTQFPNLFSKIYIACIKNALLELLKNNYDVIYCMGSVLEAGTASWIKRKLPHLHIVYIEHSGDIVASLQNNYTYRCFYRELIDSVDKIIFVSNKQRMMINKYVDLCEKSVVLNNGFYGGESVVSYVKQGSILKIISVGALIERKGYRYSIKALSQLRKEGYNFRFEIIGDGNQKEELQKLVRECGIDDVTEFRGWQTHAEVLNAMAAADVFLMPSWNESFGIVYLEAMSCGIPVIGTVGEGIEDIITDNCNGFLVRKQNYDNIYKVILKLINNPDFRHLVGSKGRMLSNEFTWRKNAEKLEKVLDDVCKLNT